MARIPYVDPETAPEAVRKTFEQLPLSLNIFRMMAHAETNFRPLLRLGTSILGEQKLAAKLRELAILCVARLDQAEYEWVQHVPIGKSTGLSDEQIDALKRGDAEAACFATHEKLVLRFTSEVVRNAGASSATLDEMMKHFSPREIMELIITIGFYMTIARIMRTVDIDLDEPAGLKVMNAVERR